MSPLALERALPYNIQMRWLCLLPHRVRLREKKKKEKREDGGKGGKVRRKGRLRAGQVSQVLVK
jgi:hypothetical protein